MIGLRVNNYELVSLLGEGGMGAVYLAEHALMGRRAAIKLLRPELTEDRGLVARFVNEARAANAIRHPNIIDVLDVGILSGQHAGQPYMMMEFLEGESLASRLAKRGTLTPAEAVEVARQTADALGAAHAKNIVHRDLKPDNLFLVPDDRRPGRELVKVLDFGIAKLRGDLATTSVKTRAGSILGTPPYMSPEQCRGLQDQVDRRTDVYALGIILYEMLTGAPPFVSAGVGDMLVKHLTEAPMPPRKLRPDIPDWLEQTILRALAKAPDERFATMDDFGAALDGGRTDTLKGAGPTVLAPRAAAPTPPGPTLRVAPAALTPATLAMPEGGFSAAAGLAALPAQANTTFSRNTGEALPASDELEPGVSPRALRARTLGVVAGAGGLVVVLALAFAGGGRPATEPEEAVRSGAASGAGPRRAAAGSAPAAASPPAAPVTSPAPSGAGAAAPAEAALPVPSVGSPEEPSAERGADRGTGHGGKADGEALTGGGRRAARRPASPRQAAGAQVTGTEAGARAAPGGVGASVAPRSGSVTAAGSVGATLPPDVASSAAPAAGSRTDAPAAPRAGTPAGNTARAKRSVEKW